MNIRHPKYYHDEVWNTLSHGIALLFVLIGGGILVWITSQAKGWLDIIAVAIYVLGAAFVYASSTAYHATRPGSLKERLQQVDHISIYFMIAGSHMPIIMRYFNNSDGYWFLGIMWTFVLIGTIYKIFWMGKFETLSIILYVFMGCLSFYLLPQLLMLMSPWLLGLVILGALLYAVGIIFYAWESLPYSHPIWHMFVVAGSVTHFIAIYSIVVGA
jgi:hemolysin III